MEGVGASSLGLVTTGLNPLPISSNTSTGDKHLTSPSTNVEIKEGPQTMLVPNVRARCHVLEYKAAKKSEWEAAERRWREWAEGHEQGWQG